MTQTSSSTDDLLTKEEAEAIARMIAAKKKVYGVKSDSEDSGRLFTIMVGGSRGWTSREIIHETMGDFNASKCRVIHGGARGLDRMADYVCRGMGFHVDDPYEADWNLHKDCRCRDKSPNSVCKYAGIRRTKEMMDEQKPDLVIAFWDGKSVGTKATIDAAKERGLALWVINP